MALVNIKNLVLASSFFTVWSIIWNFTHIIQVTFKVNFVLGVICSWPGATYINKIIKTNKYKIRVPRRLFCFWFFGDFRCGALLFVLIHVMCGCKNR